MPQKLLVSLCLCLSLLFLACRPAAAEGPTKIGTMNLQKILAVSETGKAVRADIEKKLAEYQDKLKKQEDEVVSLKDDFDKKSAVWSDDVRTRKERELKRLIQALEDDSKYAANDMKSYEQEKVEPILKKLEDVISEYGKKNNFALILDISKGVLYEDESINISDELAAELDKVSAAEKK